VVAQLFASHSSAHNELAARVKGCLADLGHDPVPGPPSAVDMATHGEAATCDYDDLTLTTAP
jgi:hypothetical protein